VFTARYGLIPYIKQITFRLLKLNIVTMTVRVSSTWMGIWNCSSILTDSLKMALRCRNTQELMLTMNYILSFLLYLIEFICCLIQ